MASASAIFCASHASVTGDAGSRSHRGRRAPRDRPSDRTALPRTTAQPAARRRRRAIAICDDDDPGIGDAAQERMLLELPVRIADAKRVVEARAPVRSALRSGRRPNAAAMRSGVIVRDRVVEPRQPSRVAREQRADEVGGPASPSTATSASQIGSAAAPPGTIMRSLSILQAARRDPERRRRGRTIHRSRPRSRSSSARIDGSAAIAPAHTSSADRFEISAANRSASSGQLEHVAPVIGGERRGDRDRARVRGDRLGRCRAPTSCATKLRTASTRSSALGALA